MPSLEVRAIPLLTLPGDVGSTYSLEYIEAIGPTDAWMTLDTFIITNNPQFYVDASAAGQALRLYRLVLLP